MVSAAGSAIEDVVGGGAVGDDCWEVFWGLSDAEDGSRGLGFLTRRWVHVPAIL